MEDEKPKTSKFSQEELSKLDQHYQEFADEIEKRDDKQNNSFIVIRANVPNQEMTSQVVGDYALMESMLNAFFDNSEEMEWLFTKVLMKRLVKFAIEDADKEATESESN